jgi:hypothetical protein
MDMPRTCDKSGAHVLVFSARRVAASNAAVPKAITKTLASLVFGTNIPVANLGCAQPGSL